MWISTRASLGLAADVFFGLLFMLYNVVAHIIVVTAIVKFDLPPVPSLVLSIEEVKLLFSILRIVDSLQHAA